MVDVHSGPEAVQDYVRTQAARGLPHVISLIRLDRDSMAALTEGLSQAEAAIRPKDAEYSVLEVLQHLNGSFARSLDRLATLSSGRPWSGASAAPQPGNIPADSPADFAEVRRQFLAGEDAVLALLE